MTDIKELGNKGEKAVAKFLKKNKYKIIENNFFCKLGEIDIIAQNKDYIIFTEVKTRTEGQMLEPKFSVDRRKQQKIIRTAAYYLSQRKTDLQPRFDIAEVTVNAKGKMSINYLENAFGQVGNYAAF